MLVQQFKGYREGQDIALIPPEHLTYPSQNVILYKGAIQTRGGTTNDGTDATGSLGIHSEHVWPDSKSGEHALRAFSTYLQLKKNDRWFTIYSGLAAAVTRVRFASWVDGNGAVIKKRLFFVDGGTTTHEWNGAVGVIASYNAGSNTATLDSAATTALLRGFDDGSGTPQTAIVVRFDANGDVDTIEEKTYTNDCTANTIVFSGALTNTPAAGDLIIAKPIANSLLTSFSKDDIFCFPVTNHIVVTNLDGGEIHGSDSATYPLDFTVPSAGSRTAASAFFLTLPGNIQAIVSRSQGNTESQPETIWFSTKDGWYKVMPLAAASTITGHWFEIKDLPLPARSGALPFMAANYKNDIVFLSQAKQLQRIETLELAARDELSLLSDEVDGLLTRLDWDGGDIKYDARYVWLTAPNDTTLLMLDMIGDPERGIPQFWNPPQTIDCASISVIDGVRYGHSTVKDETFTLFSGDTDRGIELQATIALGTSSSNQSFLGYLTHTRLGISGKKSTATTCEVTQHFETDGAKATDTVSLGDIKTYSVPDDPSFSMVPWASRAIADLASLTQRRFYGFLDYNAVPYFEHRVILTIAGENVSFQLFGIDTNQSSSQQAIGPDLFISR